MTVEELKVQFTANIEDFKQKTQKMREEMSALSSIGGTIQKDIDKALKSSSKPLQEKAKELTNLGDRLSSETSKLSASYEKISSYTDELEKLKDIHKSQTTQVETQKAKVNSLKQVYDTVKNALNKFGADIPLTKQLEEARAETDRIGEEINRLQSKLNQKRQGGQLDYKIAFLNEAEVEEQIKELTKQFDVTLDKQEELERALSSLGSNADFATKSGVKELEKQLNSATSELKKFRSEANSTNDKISSVASKAAFEFQRIEVTQPSLAKTRSEINSVHAQLTRALSPLSRLKSRFKEVFNSASSGAISTTGHINRIPSALRRIAVVAAGLRLVKGIFGELRSITLQYISSNEQLEYRVNTLKNSLGQALAPAINLIVSLFEKLMPYVLAATNIISSLIEKLSAASGLALTASALSGVASATKEVAAAQGELYGFDKITKQSDDSTSSDSSEKKNNGGTISVSQQIQDKVTEIMGIGSALMLAIGAALAFTGANLPLGLGMMAVGAVGLAATVSITDTLSDELQTKLTGILGIIGGALLAIGLIVALLGGNLPLGIGLMLAGGTTMFASYKMSDNGADGVIEGIKSVWESVKTWWSDTVTPLYTELKAKISEKVDEVKTKFQEKINSVKDKTATLTANAKEKVKGKLQEIKDKWSSVKTKSSELTANAKEKAKSKLSDIKEKWQSIKNKSTELTANAKEKTSGALKKMKDKWDGIKSKTSELTATLKDGVTETLRSIIRGIVNIVNKFINAANAVLPSKWEIDTVDMPAFANGTYIPANHGEFPAILGDNKVEGEFVTPESKLKQAVREVYDEYGNSSGGRQSITIPIYIGNKKLTKVIVDDVNRITDTTGVCPIHA